MGRVLWTRFLLTGCSFLLIQGQAFCIDDGIQLTPAMGWNSWNRFACQISEKLIQNQAIAMKTKSAKPNWEGKYISMQDVGYTFVNIDDCWEGPRVNGVLTWDPTLFPKGLPWLCDLIRSFGLKPGIYTSAGNYTCEKRPAQFGNDLNDAMFYASCGFQFLKEDWCNVPTQFLNRAGAITLYTQSYKALRKAADSCFNNPGLRKYKTPHTSPWYFTFSLCNWGAYNSWEYGAQCGHLARMSRDIQNNWGAVSSIIDQCINNKLYLYNTKGFFNDPDMLEVGNGLSQTENQAHFDIWCIQQAPLLCGNDLTLMNSDTMVFSVLTNREVIAVNQDSLNWCGRRVKAAGSLELWYKRCFTRKNGAVVTDSTQMSKSVIVFNRGNTAASYTILRSDPLEFGATVFDSVRDLWQHKVIAQSFNPASPGITVTVPAHGTAHLMFKFADKPMAINPSPFSNSSKEQLFNQIRWRNTSKGIDVFLPSGAQASLFDIQGRLAGSISALQGGNWCSIPGKSLAQGPLIAKISLNDHTLIKTISLAR